MCKMCEREMDSAALHLADLIGEYRDVRRVTEAEGLKATENEHIAALAGKLNHGVKEHYGVLNGQIAAVAIHQIATGVTELAVSLDEDQLVLAAIAANTRLKEKGLATISSDAAHELLAAITALQSQP